MLSIYQQVSGVAFGGALALVVLTNIKPLLVQVGSTTPEPAFLLVSCLLGFRDSPFPLHF
jgi:hypothetical protein